MTDRTRLRKRLMRTVKTLMVLGVCILAVWIVAAIAEAVGGRATLIGLAVIAVVLFAWAESGSEPRGYGGRGDPPTASKPRPLEVSGKADSE